MASDDRVAASLDVLYAICRGLEKAFLFTGSPNIIQVREEERKIILVYADRKFTISLTEENANETNG